MRPFAPIIATLVLVVASPLFQVGCSSPPEMVLESDIPNVQGLEPIITRDIQRSGEQVDAVEVLYRGDITATQKNVQATRDRFDDAGWSFISQQARGNTTVLNFAKDTRTARVEIALNQIEPMMSPAVLQVRPATDATFSTSPSAGIPLVLPTTSQSVLLEGFAPPPNK